MVDCTMFNCYGSKPADANAANKTETTQSSDKPIGTKASGEPCMTPAMITAIITTLLAGGTAYCVIAGVGTTVTYSAAGLTGVALVTTLALKYCPRKPAVDEKPKEQPAATDANAAANAAKVNEKDAAPAEKLTWQKFMERMMTATTDNTFDVEAEMKNLGDKQLQPLLINLAFKVNDKTAALQKGYAQQVFEKAMTPSFDNCNFGMKSGATFVQYAVSSKAAIEIIKQLATEPKLLAVPAKAGTDSKIKAGNMLVTDFVVPMVTDKNADVSAYGKAVVAAVAKNADAGDKKKAVDALKAFDKGAGAKTYAAEITALS